MSTSPDDERDSTTRKLHARTPDELRTLLWDTSARLKQSGSMGERNEMTGAELLREAARVMRARAELTTPAPWTAGKYHDNHAVMAGDEADCWVASTGAYRPSLGSMAARRDAEHVASWNPAVAHAVADLLDRVAELHDYATPDGCADYDAAIATARAYLSAPVSAGEPKENTNG